MNLPTRFEDRKPPFNTSRAILNAKAWLSAADGAVTSTLFDHGRWVLCCGALVLGLLLLMPPPHSGQWGYLGVLRAASATLKGQMTTTDITTDIVGLRELYSGGDPYPLLGPVLAKYGVTWDVSHASTHPPTAYLLTTPVVALPIAIAVAVWAWLMLAVYAMSYRQFGFPWPSAIGLAPITLLWPPAAFSLPQLTPIWLLAIAVAYRQKASVLSGLAIGVASLTKFLPAVLLFPFILVRSVRTAVAFCCVWIGAIAAVLAMNPEAIQRYFAVRENMVEQMLRADNAAPLAVAYRFSGTSGAVLLFTSLALLIALSWRRHGWPIVLMLAAYVSVAALPIAWIYSPLPLLPVFGFFVCAGNISAKTLASASFVILCVCPRVGPTSVPYIAASIVLLGTCLIGPIRLGAMRESW
jgi:Glycosyltransferase family 87